MPIAVFARLEHLQRRARHDRGDGVLVDELRMAVAAQQHAKIVELGDDALELDAVDQKNRQRSLLLANVIEERVLKVLCAVRHLLCSWMLFPAFGGVSRILGSTTNQRGQFAGCWRSRHPDF